MVKCCNGPCSQGDKACPTPEACELDESILRERMKERVADAIIAVLIVITSALLFIILHAGAQE